MASVASQLTALRLISTGKPSISAALDAIAEHIAQLEADRERILAGERDSRLSFEHARDEQAKLAIRLDECQVRLSQAWNVLRAIVDNAVLYVDGGPERYEVDPDVIDEARALLDGDSAPADTEDHDA